MPRLIDHAARRAEVVDVIVRQMADGGLESVTMRSVASALGMTPGGLHHHTSGRDDMLATAALDHGHAMLDRIEERPRDQWLLAFVPVECRAEPGRETSDPDWDAYPFATFRPFGILQMRVWLTWCTVALSHPPVADSVHGVLQGQWDLMRVALFATTKRVPDRGLTRQELTQEALALVHGLRAATCRTVEPLPLPDARQTLLAWCERTSVHSTGDGH